MTMVQNSEDVQAQLVELIQRATVKPKVRRKTKPTYGSKLRRLEGKKQRGEVKKLRQSKPPSEG